MLRLQPDPLRRRLRAAVDLELALQLFNTRRDGAPDEEARLRLCATDLRHALDALNAAAAAELDEHLRHAVDNCLAGMRYVAPHLFTPLVGVDRADEYSPSTLTLSSSQVLSAASRRAQNHRGEHQKSAGSEVSFGLPP